jgi:sugar phosphate isomerase/epimerase
MPIPNELISRRKFLVRTGATALSGMVAGPWRKLFAETDFQPHIVFPTTPRERISVTSYPFRAYIESPANRDRDPKLPGMDLRDFPADVVKKFGVHNIEPHSRHFRSLDADYLSSFREALQKANVKVVDIAVSGQDSFYDADAATRARAVAFGKKFVDVAGQIDSPSIRVHIVGSKNSQPDVARATESLRELARYGAGNNVIINLENDDLVSENAFFIVKVIEAVKHPFLHALPDIGNSMASGDADFNYRAVTAMFGHAYNICHIKDGVTADDGKFLGVDLKRSFEILKASGFRGYCSMEYDTHGDPYGPTARLIEETIEYLS